MRFGPVELPLPHFDVSQLEGLQAATKQAVLSETHLTYLNTPSTRANRTLQPLGLRSHPLPDRLCRLVSRLQQGVKHS